MKMINTLTKNDIDLIIKKCIDNLKSYDFVNTIILFGSYARGDYSIRHSDIDLYVIINSQKDSKLERKLFREINQISKFIQIHLNFEYNTLLKEGSLLRYNILKEGEILYEKTKSIFLKKDFDLEEVFLLQLDLSNLQPNQKSNFKRSMLKKYKKNVLEYSGNSIIIYKPFFDIFSNICKNKNIGVEILKEFLFREQKDFDEI